MRATSSRVRVWRLPRMQAAGAGERRDPAGMHPVRLLVGGKAMDEHDRIAGALVQVGDLDRAGMERSRGRDRNHGMVSEGRWNLPDPARTGPWLAHNPAT